MTEDHLIGWLCIMRHNLSNQGEGAFYIPGEVKRAMERRAWVEVGEPDEDGRRSLHVTEAGTLVSDLAAPEWGINPVPAVDD